MKKALLLISILVFAFFLFGCEQQNAIPNAVVCNAPFIQVDNACCLDQNANSVCDDKESVVNESINTSVSETIPASQPVNPEVLPAEEIVNDSSSQVGVDTQVHIEDAGQVNDFLDIFKGKETNIIFGQETGAPLVAATINLLTYFVYPKNMEYYTILPTATSDDFPDTNVILLGNGCNNNFIKELLSLDNCYGSLEDNIGIFKMSKVNGNYVLFIMAKEDKDVYYMVNSLVSDQYQTSGNEIEVDLSSLNN
jgi:hypothetical protein